MQDFMSKTTNDKFSDTLVSIELSKIIKELLIDLNNSFNDITSAIISKYKPYQSILEINDFDNIQPEHIKDIELILIHCKNIFPKRFFDILYQNESMFDDENIDTHFLPNIEFKDIYFDTTSSKTKETIWKYLQLILFTIITDVDNKNIFGNNEKLFEAINTDEFKNKLEDTVNELNHLFTKHPNESNKSNESNESNKSNKSNESNESNESNKSNESNESNESNNIDPTKLFNNIFNELKQNIDLSNNDNENVNNIFNKFKEELNDISLNNLPNLPDLENIFNNIDISNNNSENFKELFENMQNMFSNINQDTSNNSNNSNNSNDKFKNIFENMPKPEEIHNHINNLINGKIGLLAKELAEETANELNIDETNMNNVNDVFNQMFKNPTKLMSLVNNITTKIDKKMKDGSIKESELLEEATSLFKNMGDVPGMGNFNDLLKSMNMDKFMPKGGKFNNNAFQNMMDQNIRMTKMKERMRKKTDNKNNMQYSNNYSESTTSNTFKETPTDLNDLTNNLQKAMNDNNSFIQNILKQQQQQHQEVDSNNNLDNSNMQCEKKHKKKNKNKNKK